MACGVTELEKAYGLVQDLDAAKSSYTFRSQNQMKKKSDSSQYLNRFQPQVSTPKIDTSDKCVEKDTKEKSIEKESFKVSPTTKCYKCQVYKHIAANCSINVKFAFVNGVPVAELESDSDEFIYQGK